MRGALDAKGKDWRRMDLVDGVWIRGAVCVRVCWVSHSLSMRVGWFENTAEAIDYNDPNTPG